MSAEEFKPPRLFLRFFRWFCHPDCREDIEGDLMEVFHRNAATAGHTAANWRFAIDVIKLFRPGVIRPLKPGFYSNSYSMLKNYLLTALRNMKRDRVFAFMNMTGLAIGIGCGLVIYKIITYELSFDAYHTHYGNIYRLINEFNHPQYGTGFNEGQVHPLGEALRNDIAGVEAVMTYYAREAQVTVTDDKGNTDRFREYQGVAYVEPNFFRVFDFKFIAGDATTALRNKGSVVITESLAGKYFRLNGHDVVGALGKTIVINNNTPVMVTGIVADPPGNTDLPFTLIGDYASQVASNPYFNGGTDWDEYNSNTNCYLLVRDGGTLASLQRTLPDFLVKYSGKERASFVKYQLQPLSQLHYDSRVANYNKRQTSYAALGILAAIGAFLVISACINFINMSTAQAIKRAKEIGVRKALGVRKPQLVRQFLAETLFTSALASFAGLVVAQTLFMLLESILGYRLQVDVLTNGTELLFIIALVVVTGLLSGFYPAMVMASMNAIKALKNSINARSATGLLSTRRALVVTQFVISQVLIIGTIVVGAQMDYFLGNDIGFSKDAVIITRLPASSPEKLQALKTAVEGKTGVEAVALSVASPMAQFRVDNPIVHTNVSKDDRVSGNLKTADEDYIELFGLELIAGRNLPEAKDTKEAVVNRKLTTTLGYKNPEEALGDKFRYASDLEFTIIGVVEDFHSVSFHHPVENVILSNLPWNIFEMAIRLNTGSGRFADIQDAVNEIKTEWDRLYPETIFDYAFLDEQIAMMYANERKTSQLFGIFSVIAIFIGCLGLYGLVSYMANQKAKEIGIRKVMGATTSNIISIFSREMILLVFLAFVVAAPVAWYVMTNWLQGFQYRVDLAPMYFLVALGGSLMIALVTIGYKAIAASLANPVDSLRSE